MVAVRSAGLGLGAIIGYANDSVGDEASTQEILEEKAKTREKRDETETETETKTKTKTEPESEESEDEEEHSKEKIQIQSMVTEEYLSVLVRLANDRFTANRERMRRFEEDLVRRRRGGVKLNGAAEETRNGTRGDAAGREKQSTMPTAKGRRKEKRSEWEDDETRRARKRAEGLASKEKREKPAIPMNNDQKKGKEWHEEVEDVTEEDFAFLKI